ncbi:RmlC-like cupin domain-containing protein [Coniella lustricola]|uniref:RmlC-like cupin domain-containing protein n=1 Tax=Coniella lustricola TaxID=2025994 RepID=A0A2T3AFX3_9PEZI|nr:RmlC-like cupin domain-containing protein [Coniella lustricola]
MASRQAIKPFFSQTKFAANQGSPDVSEPPAIASLIASLQMLTHIEGGYFVETDRDPLLIRSPFPLDAASQRTLELVAQQNQQRQQQLPQQPPPALQRPGFDPHHRNASTTIFYLLTPSSPQGNFHRNRARTVHTLHKGRGQYVLIHPDGRIETFVVGQDVARGEKLQWIVEGGIYKASFLLPDRANGNGEELGESREGLLISETVVPGFEFCDHDFLTRSGLMELVSADGAKQLESFVRLE